jgi:hypothetical protein
MTIRGNLDVLLGSEKGHKITLWQDTSTRNSSWLRLPSIYTRRTTNSERNDQAVCLSTTASTRNLQPAGHSSMTPIPTPPSLATTTNTPPDHATPPAHQQGDKSPAPTNSHPQHLPHPSTLQHHHLVLLPPLTSPPPSPHSQT